MGSLSQLRRSACTVFCLAILFGSGTRAQCSEAFLRQSGWEEGRLWLYLHHRDSPSANRLRIPVPGPSSEVSLSPSGTMIAYTVNRSITSNVPRDSPEAYEVAVVDTAGNSLMAFSRAIRLAWSPAGDTLAVAISRAPGEMLSTFDSIVVWTPHDAVISQAHVSARRGSIGWAGPDTVLAGSWVQGPVDAIPLKTGIAAVSKHRGTSVSADGLFSIYPTMGGLGIGVYEDRTGANFAYRSVELLELPRLGEIGPARWVSSPQ